MKTSAKRTATIYNITKLQNLYTQLANELHIEEIELQITPDEVAYLQGLAFEKGGIKAAATYVGVQPSTYLTVCAGFTHCLRPHTVLRVRRHLDKWRSRQ